MPKEAKAEAPAPEKQLPAHTFRVKLCEQAERYDEMLIKLKESLKIIGGRLNEEERQMVAVTYKNVVGARRASLRIIASILAKEKVRSGEDSAQTRIVTQYKQTVVGELQGFCTELIKYLDTTFLPSSTDTEITVFYLKLKADYYRYLCEFTEGSPDYSRYVKGASEAYEEATKMASQEVGGVPPTDTLRLGLSLNYSVFLHEVMGETEKAAGVSKTAFDSSVAELDKLDSASNAYKETTALMQLLRDNSSLWSDYD